MDKPWLKFYEKNVPHSLVYPRISLDSLLTEAARKYPNNTATNFVLRYVLGDRLTIGGKLTFRKLNELVDRMATALFQLGVRKGDRIAVMLPNSPHYIITFFAAARLGAIIVNTNPTYTSRELKHQLEDSGAETIVILNLLWPRLREIQHDTALKRVIVAYVDDTLPFPMNRIVRRTQERTPDWVTVKPEHNIFYFDHLLEKYRPTPPKIEIDADDPVLFQYTGGTTGTPKAAMISHYNLIANVIQCTAWISDCKPGGEKFMSAIPFFHVYGMTVAMLLGVYLGSEQVIVPNPRPIENVMRIIAKERCTLFPGVPAMYIGIVNHKDIDQYNLRSVRACLSGSAPLPMEIQERFGALTGGQLVEGYGLTEAAPVTHANPVFGQRKSGSIGIPISDVESKIIDMETGEQIPYGDERTGEMLLRGPQVMRGYWNKPEDTAETIDADGWLHTGDICRTDSDGYFYIVDRKKDMIIASGFKVLPRDVEEVLYMHPKVLEAVVVGVPHPKRGDDTVKAFVVPKPNTEPTADELKEFCKIHLAPYKVPREVEFRSELPKTTVGKVLRRVLVDEEKARMARERGAPPAPPVPPVAPTEPAAKA